MSNKKLKYNLIRFKDLDIYFAKSKCKTMHITIKQDYNVYCVVPFFVSELETNDFLEKKYDWIKESLDKMKNKTEYNSNINILFNSKKLNEEEKLELISKIDIYIKKYEELLNITVNKYSLRCMKTLWGSCSTKSRNIRFNEKLYYKSDSFIEYIVLHELTHILVPNHSKKFYEIIKKYIPNYKKIK